MKNRRNRKLFYIVGIEVIVLVAVLAGWMFFSRSNDGDVDNPSKKNYMENESNLPEVTAPVEVGTEDSDTEQGLEDIFVDSDNEIDVLNLEHEIAEEALISSTTGGDSVVGNNSSSSSEDIATNSNHVVNPSGDTDTTSNDTTKKDIKPTADDFDIPAGDYVAAMSTPQSGTILQSAGAMDVVFYTQIDERWAKLYYGGTDTIEKYACGPTSMSIVISTLTDITIDPVQMSAWAYQNGYWFAESGSAHTLIPDAAEAFGLQVEGVENTPEAGEKIKNALKDGKLIVALMGKGQFTKSGHFIVLRGITEDGKIIIADPNSEELTNKTWDLSTITGEARAWANAGGPFWIIWK